MTHGEKRLLTKQAGISLKDLSALLCRQLDIRSTFRPTCEHCGERFFRDSRWGRNLRWCRSCSGPVGSKGWGLLHDYDLSYPEYLWMKERCGNRCEICERSPGGRFKALNVDHDHKTGKVRGLLCGLCNRLIGQLERIDFGTRALAYLERNR